MRELSSAEEESDPFIANRHAWICNLFEINSDAKLDLPIVHSIPLCMIQGCASAVVQYGTVKYEWVPKFGLIPYFTILPLYIRSSSVRCTVRSKNFWGHRPFSCSGPEMCKPFTFGASLVQTQLLLPALSHSSPQPGPPAAAGGAMRD